MKTVKYVFVCLLFMCALMLFKIFIEWYFKLVIGRLDFVCGVIYGLACVYINQKMNK